MLRYLQQTEGHRPRPCTWGVGRGTSQASQGGKVVVHA